MKVFLKCLIAGTMFLSLSTPNVLADAATIVEKLSPMIAGLKAENISDTPIKGLHQIRLGTEVFYVSADGRYLLQGELLDVENRINLTATALNGVRQQAIQGIDEKQMIVFKAENEKHQITVFSDIDCGYCRKMHAEISAYLAKGITVRYLFMPRSGINTPSYHKAVSVWCAKDRNQALTSAKKGINAAKKTCDNPVDEHLLVAKQLGITGTPAIITESGRLVPGYIPAAKITNYLTD